MKFAGISAKVSAKYSDSAGIQQNILLSARVQQNFSKTFDSAGIHQNILLSARVQQFFFLKSQQLAIKALNEYYFVFTAGRVNTTTADLAGLLPTMERGVFGTNGFQPYLGFT